MRTVHGLRREGRGGGWSSGGGGGGGGRMRLWNGFVLMWLQVSR